MGERWRWIGTAVVALALCGCGDGSDGGTPPAKVITETTLLASPGEAYDPGEKVVLRVEHPRAGNVGADVGGLGQDEIPFQVTADQPRRFCLDSDEEKVEIVFFDPHGVESARLSGDDACTTPLVEPGPHRLQVHNRSQKLEARRVTIENDWVGGDAAPAAFPTFVNDQITDSVT